MSVDVVKTHNAPTQGFYAYTALKGVYYGPGCLKTALPELLKTIGGIKALIVTGKSLHDKSDLVKNLEALLKEHNAYGATFFDIGQHAPIAGIRKAVEIYKQHGCDFIVSLGGGSPIDASKVILHFIQKENGGQTPRQIAVPTTLSAAEYTALGGYTNEEGHKVGVSSPELAPAGIILDPELTLATPDRLWLSTGLRALDHAIEGLYRPIVPPPIKTLYYAAISDLFKYLPVTKADPKDIGARQKLQVAAWMSLWPLQPKEAGLGGFGLSHSLGHALGAAYSIPHGITSCLTLAPVITLKAKIGSTDDKAALAQVLPYLGQTTTGSMEGDVVKLSVLISGLVKRLDLESTLTQFNVPLEDISKIASTALGEQGDDSQLAQVVELLRGLF